jgi:hypothetical protein
MYSARIETRRLIKAIYELDEKTAEKIVQDGGDILSVVEGAGVRSNKHT